MRATIVLALALLLTGCSLAPSSDQLKMLMESERSWCLSVTSIYGTARMGGTGLQGGSLKCTQEGLQIEAVREAKPTP